MASFQETKASNDDQGLFQGCEIIIFISFTKIKPLPRQWKRNAYFKCGSNQVFEPNVRRANLCQQGEQHSTMDAVLACEPRCPRFDSLHIQFFPRKFECCRDLSTELSSAKLMVWKWITKTWKCRIKSRLNKQLFNLQLVVRTPCLKLVPHFDLFIVSEVTYFSFKTWSNEKMKESLEKDLVALEKQGKANFGNECRSFKGLPSMLGGGRHGDGDGGSTSQSIAPNRFLSTWLGYV